MQYKVESQNNGITDFFSYGSMAIFLFAIFMVVGNFQQGDFFTFFPYYTIGFVAYIYLAFYSKVKVNVLFALAIIARLGLIFFFPNLSDDIFRFFWDGVLSLNGINPYGILPSEAVNLGIGHLDQSLFEKLNSPDYFTIYPPISQLYFLIASFVGDLFWSGIIMKILFILTEILGFWYLTKLLDENNIDSRFGFFYFLNPLIIIEGVGNLHFEVVMIAFFAVSLYFLFRNRLWISSVFMALSIGVKLLPLMILPYLWFRMKAKDRLTYFSVLAITSLIIFIPVFGGIEIISFMKSIDLYFRKFEFNASLYYILRYVGQTISGYNLIKYIGPLLALFVLGYNVKCALKSRTIDLPSFGMYGLSVWTIYLLCATTVHPWYVAMLVFLSVFTRFKYAVVWSYLIFISYINYLYDVYYENLAWISVEYILLFTYMVMEYYYHRRQNLQW